MLGLERDILESLEFKVAQPTTYQVMSLLIEV